MKKYSYLLAIVTIFSLASCGKNPETLQNEGTWVSQNQWIQQGVNNNWAMTGTTIAPVTPSSPTTIEVVKPVAPATAPVIKGSTEIIKGTSTPITETPKIVTTPPIIPKIFPPAEVKKEPFPPSKPVVEPIKIEWVKSNSSTKTTTK